MDMKRTNKKLLAALLAAAMTLSLTACGGSGGTEGSANEPNEVIDAAQNAAGAVGDAVTDAVKDVEEEAVPGSTINREDYKYGKDYLMATIVTELDYASPFWSPDGGNEYEGYTKTEVIDNIKYYLNETTKEAVCTNFDAKALQAAGVDTLTIPAEVNGYKVIATDMSSPGNKFIKKIVIEDGVREIHDSFLRYELLEEVVIPESVQLITEGSFWDCRSLKNVTLPKDLRWLHGLGYTAISQISIPEKVAYLDAFEGAEIAQVTFQGEALQIVAGSAFNKCQNLKALHLPNSVHTIGDGLLYGSAVEDFTVPTSLEFTEGDMNSSFGVTMEDTPYANALGSPFVIWNDILVSYCDSGNETSVTIPDGVKKIGVNAFASNDSIKEVIVPEGVEVLGNNCFRGLKYLKTLVLPSTITQISYATKENMMEERNWTIMSANWADFVLKLTGENSLVEKMCEVQGWTLEH